MNTKPNSGSFKKGQSGNPGGTPKGLIRSIREEFEGDTIKILRVFRDLAIGLSPKGYDENEIKASDRIRAGAEVLDRVIGKPKESVEVSGGISPQAEQLLAALRMTPEERRKQLAAEDAADAAALADATSDGDA